MENGNVASANFIDLDVRLARYLQTWFIVLCMLMFSLVVPLVVAIVLVVVQHKKINKALREYESRINEMRRPATGRRLLCAIR